MSMSANPSQLVIGMGNQTITIRISAAGPTPRPWTAGTPGAPTFPLANTGSGASIVSQVVVNANTATLVIAPGSTAGVATITDPVTGQTVAMGVAAGPSSAVVGTAPSAGVGTAVVRTTSKTVTVTVSGSPATVTNVISARHSLGLDLAVGTAQFSVPAVSDLQGATYWTPVAIALSAGSHSATWKGLITEFDYTLWPRQIDVLCTGYLVRCERQKNPVTGGTPLATLLGGTGTDQDIVNALFAASGLVDPGSGNPPTLTTSGTGQIVGVGAPQPYVWAEKETALAYIQRLDQACCSSTGPSGWRTYDDIGGVVVRQPIDARPAVSATATFTEGTDIFTGNSKQTVLTAANKVVVSGYDYGTGAGPVTNTQTGSNTYLPAPPGVTPPYYIVEELSAPMIEYATDGARPVGYGLSCEGAAKYLLSQFNQTQVRLECVTPRDDVIHVADTIKIDTPSHAADRLGYQGNLYVLHVDREVDERGQFSQTLIVLVGAS